MKSRTFSIISTALGLALALLPAGPVGSLVEWSSVAHAQQGRGSTPDDPPGPNTDRQRDRPAPRRPAPKDGKAEAAEPKPIPKSMRRPGANAVPEAASERAKLLDELYIRLATAGDEAVAARIANAIEHVWVTSGSDTVSLLLERARRAAGEKKHDLAIKLLDRATQLVPDHAEVFYRRASVNLARSNMQSALGDLRRVLALDPNNYKALEALGQIFKELGRKKAALEVFRKLYEVHPHMSGAKSTLDELEREVDGQAS